MAIQEARPSSVRAISNQNYIGSQTLAQGGTLTNGLAKPLIDSELYRRFGVQYMTGFMEMIGNKKKVDRDEYFHYEQDFIRTSVRVAQSTLGADNAAVDLTVVSGDRFTIKGNNSPYISGTDVGTTTPRVNDIVRIPTGTASFGIEAKVTAVSGNTFTVVPVVLDEAIPALAENAEVIIVGNSHAERTGSPDSRNTRLIEYKNNTQIFKDSHTVSGTSMENVTWLDNLGKENGDKWYLEGMFDTFLNFKNDVELQLLTGQNISNTTLAGLSGQEEDKKTRGLISDILESGIEEAYTSGSLALQDFKNLTLQLNKYKGAEEYTLFCGYELNQEIDDLLREGDGGSGLAGLNGMKNGGIIYNMFNGSEDQFVKFSFSGFEYGGFTFYKRNLPILSDVTALGNEGFTYSKLGIGIPMGDTVVYNSMSSNSTSNVPTITINNLREYKEWMTGGQAPVPTSDIDELTMNLLEETGLEAYGLNRFFLLTA